MAKINDIQNIIKQAAQRNNVPEYGNSALKVAEPPVIPLHTIQSDKQESSPAPAVQPSRREVALAYIKEHFIEDGFSDYILISNLENELDRIIEKY